MYRSEDDAIGKGFRCLIVSNIMVVKINIYPKEFFLWVKYAKETKMEMFHNFGNCS